MTSLLGKSLDKNKKPAKDGHGKDRKKDWEDSPFSDTGEFIRKLDETIDKTDDPKDSAGEETIDLDFDSLS